MAELKIEIPEDLEAGVRELSRREVDRIVRDALRERLSERLMFKMADELLEDSQVSDELALQLGGELKEHVAKKHGL
ncbi:MAG: hypothetical protein R6U10_06255 [Thermoplasmatota archaeon]